mgnify:CR=1 FL=1
MGGSGQTTAGTGNPTAGSSSGGTDNTGGAAPQGGQPQGGSGGAGGTGNPGPVCPKPADQICHEFIANDNGTGFNRVNYVDEFASKNPGGVVWAKSVGHASTAPEDSPRTIESVGNAKTTGAGACVDCLAKSRPGAIRSRRWKAWASCR